ncbi:MULTISPECIES: nuclease-related domain-containing protein [unclassified Fusibacter]|uniref:nuclease-related domain-containing protein n=1 Tax=unclassified Fusibacter TaxID=2624464 RepID=UPI001FA9C405|nr:MULTISPECIES: nuclease-related domain-containing protein [unclassified Fusibacter]MCK8058396.1 NERD domain-containing protein [Fusibacter sp. A2]
MQLFSKMKEPVFLKESSDLEQQLIKLKELEPKLNEEGKAKLLQEMKMIEYGLLGEKNIAFELKNSHMPMFVLHDIYLESEDLTAQIDYLVFTRKLCFVIESKNMVGDIEINANGDFIRTTKFGHKKNREGIYSPITQNQRHLELMKKIRLDNADNIL